MFSVFYVFAELFFLLNALHLVEIRIDKVGLSLR